MTFSLGGSILPNCMGNFWAGPPITSMAPVILLEGGGPALRIPLTLPEYLLLSFIIGTGPLGIPIAFKGANPAPDSLILILKNDILLNNFDKTYSNHWVNYKRLVKLLPLSHLIFIKTFLCTKIRSTSFVVHNKTSRYPR